MEDMELEEFNKWQNGKVYKIIDNTNGDVYIGSTIHTLQERLKRHINDLKNYLIGKQNYVTSFKILANNNYEIVLIELYPCSSRDELKAREKLHIKANTCVNKNIPGRTPKEYRVDNQERIRKRRKNYYEKNQKQILEKKQQYYNANKKTINEIFICDCGSHYRKVAKTRHFNTLKHKTFVANQNIEPTSTI